MFNVVVRLKVGCCCEIEDFNVIVIVIIVLNYQSLDTSLKSVKIM